MNEALLMVVVLYDPDKTTPEAIVEHLGVLDGARAVEWADDDEDLAGPPYIVDVPLPE